MWTRCTVLPTHRTNLVSSVSSINLSKVAARPRSSAEASAQPRWGTRQRLRLSRAGEPGRGFGSAVLGSQAEASAQPCWGRGPQRPRGRLAASPVKSLPANAGDTREAGLIPESGGSPGGGHGSPLQHSCLENPMDREAWRAVVHRVAPSQERPK